MEHFLTIIVVITLVCFISIVLSKPVPEEESIAPEENELLPQPSAQQISLDNERPHSPRQQASSSKEVPYPVLGLYSSAI